MSTNSKVIQGILSYWNRLWSLCCRVNQKFQYDYFSKSNTLQNKNLLYFILKRIMIMKGFPRWHSGKNPPANARDAGLIPGSRRSPSRKLQPTPVFLPGRFHGQRSLAGYSPWGHRVRHDWAHSTAAHRNDYDTILCQVQIFSQNLIERYLNNENSYILVSLKQKYH